jgi:parvulin-like peptidyl-prolyl isomerase
MKKRTLEQMREVIRSRRMKGKAFMIGETYTSEQYDEEIEEIAKELEKMSVEELKEKYSNYLY